MSDNLEIWEAVQTTPGDVAHKFSTGDYSGTSANLTFNAKRATEIFGPYGLGWWVEIERDELVNLGTAAEPSFVHTLQIALHYKHGGKEGIARGFGQTSASYMTRNGYRKVDSDYAKKSMTDAIKKALQLLGFSADIWMGLWDDDKYVQKRREEYKEAKRNGNPNGSGYQSNIVKDRQTAKADGPPPGFDEPPPCGPDAMPPHDPDTGEVQDDDQTEQQAAEDVLVIYDKDTNETEGAATATEAAKALAGRMKAEGYFNASRMLQWNMDWIQHLPRNWQDRLEQIVTGKKEAEGSAAQQHFGKGKVA